MRIGERLHELRQPNLQRVLVIDIETSPHLAWTFKMWDANISRDMVVQPSRILCFAAQWADEKRVRVHCEWDDGGREAMLEELWRLLDEADIVVGYNSDGFDLKHIQREFFTAGYGPPSPWLSLDLLKIIRQRFKFPSNRLGAIGEELELGGKLETGGWPLWQAVLDGDEKARKKFAAYNKRDVQLTTDLLHTLGPWLKGTPHAGLWTGNMACCHACGSTDLEPAGLSRTRTRIYLRAHCGACGAWNRIMPRGQTRPA